jgi:predicted phosphodiesterase
MAIDELARCGVDLCLAGHLHVEHVGHLAQPQSAEGRELLLVQAGTATSTRARGEANSFNVLRVDRHSLQVERHGWHPDERRFLCLRRQHFRRADAGWQATPAE